MVRKIFFYKKYFETFYNNQNEKVRTKIDFVLDLIRNVERVPEKFLKHIEGSDGLFEIRVKSVNNIFRFFCFFEDGNIIIILNNFQKKTDKTPKNEILQAEKLRKEYFNVKE